VVLTVDVDWRPQFGLHGRIFGMVGPTASTDPVDPDCLRHHDEHADRHLRRQLRTGAGEQTAT